MVISKVVIHELVKAPRVNDASTYLSNGVLALTDNVKALVTSLDNAYGKDTITYGIFSADGRHFPTEYARYFNGTKTDQDFINFTGSALNNLRDQIRNVNLAKGGFFIFAEYSFQGIAFVGVYLVRDSDGVLFKRNEATHTFAVDSIKYMNTDRLAMGCRINNNRYPTLDGKYLSLIKNKQVDISEYFYNWIAVLQPESSSEFTDLLYDIVTNINPPNNTETNAPLSVDEFRRNVVDYIATQPSQVVNLFQMGLHFYGNDRQIVDFAQQQNIVIDYEFKVNKQRLKKFTRIEINSDGINLKFARGEMHRKIKPSATNTNQVIIESERFASALRRELEQ